MDELNLSKLSKKELEVLALWVCGQTAKQSAGYLMRSNRTIESHRDNIKIKLGIYCATHLRRQIMKCSEFNDILKKGMSLILTEQK